MRGSSVSRASNPPVPTPWDLENEGTPEYQKNLALAMRCIVAVMADPETPMTHQAIADKVGLELHVVVEAMSSEECKELLKENCIKECGMWLNKGVHIAGEIMTKSKSDDTRLAALRSLTTLYRTMCTLTDKHTGAAGEEGILKLLNQLERADVEIHETVEVNGAPGESGPPDSEASPSYREDEGGSAPPG